MNQSSKATSLNRPIVGVILGMSPIPLKKMDRYPRLRKLADANRQAKTILNFFSCKDVDISNQKVKGTYYNFKTKRWEKKMFPFPDVIYVRGGSGEKIDDLLAEFDRFGIMRMNPIHAFNKGDLYELLNRNEKIRTYLPPTKIVETIKSRVQSVSMVRCM